MDERASDPACVFCRIAADRASAAIVTRGPSWVAFAPDHPAALGHTLIIPARHARDFLDISDQEVATLGQASRDLAAAVVAETGADGVNLITSAGAAAEQTIFHLHIHVLPRHGQDGVSLWPDTQPKYSSRQITDVCEKIALRYTASKIAAPTAAEAKGP